MERLGDHPNLLAVALDVTDEAQAHAAAKAAVGRFGRIDIPFNNAGYGLLGAVEEASAEEIETLYRINVFGLFRTDFLDSTSLATSPAQIADYHATAGAMRDFAGCANHAQPGNPERLAQVLVKFVDAPNPPVRLPLGSDTVGRIEQKIEGLQRALHDWRQVSVSPDFTRTEPALATA